MIPYKSNYPIPNKYFLLEPGDEIKIGDEYYNNFRDEWVPVDKMHMPDGTLVDLGPDDLPIVGDEWSTDIKPVRRKNHEYSEGINPQSESKADTE